jgi:hypothetical protein
VPSTVEPSIALANNDVGQVEAENTDESLQKDIDRIREERERLSRLIELGKMEERLRQQQAAQRKGGPS